MRKTARIQITVNEDMLPKLDYYAERMGVTRSALCAVWLGDAILNHDKAYALLDNMKDRMADELLSDDATKDAISKIFSL